MARMWMKRPWNILTGGLYSDAVVLLLSDSSYVIISLLIV